jgi:hypothetical protein
VFRIPDGEADFQHGEAAHGITGWSRINGEGVNRAENVCSFVSSSGLARYSIDIRHFRGASFCMRAPARAHFHAIVIVIND